MRARTRHPRAVAMACRIYRVTIRAYPAEFRRAFGHDLITTFRNRLEDVLDEGGIVDWLAFSGHITVDWIRTCSSLLMDSGTRRLASCELSKGLAPDSSGQTRWHSHVCGWMGLAAGWFALVAVLAYPALTKYQPPKPTWLVWVFGWYAVFSIIGAFHRIRAVAGRAHAGPQAAKP
jgi:hypothetical protein